MYRKRSTSDRNRYIDAKRGAPAASRLAPATLGWMPADAAELSSLATTLTELEHRLGALGEAFEGTDHDDVVAALFEAERTIRAATRSVERARQALG